jgi:DNA-binding NtrC family response regulator
MRKLSGGDLSVILVVTARDKPEDLQEVLEAGADDYLFKPVFPKLLNMRLAIAEQRVRDRTDIQDLRRLLDAKARFHDLVGRSKAMNVVYEQIRELGRVDTTVLIEGQTGSGKELVARALHASSQRKSGPFIPVNCAGLTDSLLGSQLFGHKRGAFTGAIADSQGFFEAANGGTLLLDEIGDVPLNVQTNLLRVLEAREITRIGESRPRKIDVRVLAATNRDLGKEVEAGNFRADLLYRIRVARVQIPALRDRRGDIPLLVEAFLGESRVTTGKSVDEVSHETMRILLEHPWPGNVRELKNAIEYAVIRCSGSVIHPGDLPPEIVDPADLPFQTDDSSILQFPSGGTHPDEKERFLAALERANGNRTVAATLLGISRATLYRRLAKLGINSEK